MMRSNTYFTLNKYHSDCQVKDDEIGWIEVRRVFCWGNLKEKCH